MKEVKSSYGPYLLAILNLFMSAQNFHFIHANRVSKHNHLRVKGGAKNYCHIVVFSRVSCLNFNHVIIVKDFHNVFAYYGRSQSKEVK